MIKPIIADMEKQMKKTIESFRIELTTMRTGRAYPSLVENIKVEYYGTSMDIHQLAGISIPEARTIEIKPWDINALPEIEKALLKSNLGITPMNDGMILRLILPKLTEERRVEMVKTVKKNAENFRIAIRTNRRNALENIKKAEKEKQISKDDLQNAEHEIQKITDAYIQQIDTILSHKEKEIMEV